MQWVAARSPGVDDALARERERLLPCAVDWLIETRRRDGLASNSISLRKSFRQHSSPFFTCSRRCHKLELEHA